MIRFLRAIAAIAFVGGGLTIGATAALAQTATQSTTLSLTVPTAISFTGLQATYSATLVPNSTTNVFMGTAATPLAVSTNDPLGYHLTVQASAANFVGTTSSTNTIPSSSDSVQFCTNPAGSGCGGTGLQASLATAAQQIRNTTVAGSDDFAVLNAITIPGSQAADTYVNTITLVAISN